MERIHRKPKLSNWLAGAGLIAMLAFQSPAHAFGSYLDAFNALYGTANTSLDNCAVCHNNFTTGGGQGGRSINPYGLAVEGATGADITARIQSIELEFSDSDNTNNADESNTVFFPGWDCTNYTLAGGSPPANLADLVDPDDIGCTGGGNLPPTAVVSCPGTVDVGVSLTCDGTGSSDPENGPLTYFWDFGDGVGTETGPTPSYTYVSAGVYDVTLTVTDDVNLTGTDVTQVTVTDPSVPQPPISDPNGPYSGRVGEPVVFDGTGSIDPDGGALTYAWDFGDGVGTGTGSTPSYTYNTIGVYDVTLTVTDDEGLMNTNTTSANISEAPACSGLTFTAEWKARGNGQLVVSGAGVPDGQFILSNAFDPNQILGTRNGKNGMINFHVNGKNLDPVPCRVQVDQPDVLLCGQADVVNAPADCAPTGQALTARGDLYSTPVGDPITVTASRLSGVLYNDFGGVPPLTAELAVEPASGTVDLNSDGSFTYTPGPDMTDNQTDTFTYQVMDASGDTAAADVVIQALSKQTDFKIFMNYELGMHCTGFEFAYCCVLPPYNSILAQVIKPAQGDPAQAGGAFVDGFPRLLEGSPTEGLDGLNRETVVRDWDHKTSSFRKYQLRYYHDAQPRQEGNTSKPNTTTTLISAVEGNSLQYFNTVFDSAQPDPATNALVYGPYNGYQNVVQGSGIIGDVPTDHYANAWLNHFYIYSDLEGSGPGAVSYTHLTLPTTCNLC